MCLLVLFIVLFGLDSVVWLVCLWIAWDFDNSVVCICYFSYRFLFELLVLFCLLI